MAAAAEQPSIRVVRVAKGEADARPHYIANRAPLTQPVHQTPIEHPARAGSGSNSCSKPAG
jgi:hypothetical protein